MSAQAVETKHAETKHVVDMCAWLHPWDRSAFEELKAGGVTCVGVTCTTWEGSQETLRKIADLYDVIEQNSDLALLVKGAADLRAAAESGRVGVLLHFQNTSALDDDIRLVRLYRELGVRVIQLTYNTQNSVGAGCYEGRDSGLTEFGTSLVRELNDCGILIDVSHCGDRTAMEAMAASRAPVVITHANLRRFADKTRNKSDEVCRAVAEQGGIIGLATYSNLLPRGADTSVEEFCDLVEATVELVGIEHVGLGTDYYDGMPPEMVRGWTTGRWSRAVPAHMDLVDPDWKGEVAPFTDWFRSPRDMPNVGAALDARGFDETSVNAVMGRNWVRLMSQVFDG